ncbi:SMP-30/gluconolactonase/LRE family protein [Microbacterium sp. LMI12-1-1.1]|uniref:SMP-30/gluconolactonase/LRE family protein n=1 Tax=Microbacterium sp. LMI12-1-1.1 TaxID=3135225 RepID=UPI00343CB210
MRRLSVAALAALTLMGATGCAAAADASTPARPGDPGEAQLERLVQVSSVHEATGMTLVEGPVIGPDGDLYVVDVTAPPGAAKVMRVDLESTEVSTVYTDDTSAITSAQFSPHDGRLYLTDFLGTIISTTADGEDARTFFDAEVEGARIAPDDIAFDEEGHLYVTDSQGAQDPYWQASGRLLRIDRDGATATVLASELPAPNGLAFTPGADGLWVSQNTGNRIDFLRLDAEGTAVATAHPAVFASVGEAQIDSLATDADGNLYVGLHHRAAVLVYDAHGELLRTIEAPAGDDVTSATNVAIVPGETTGYATVSGPGGGFVYTFEALADGIRSSNGG